MKKLLLAVLIAIPALAQNVAVLTHEAANSEQFKQGCPGGWPYAWKEIGKDTKLPEGFEPTWVVMTEVELKERLNTLTAAKESWNKAQEEAPKIAEAAALEAKRTETVAVISEIESVFKTWESADEKSRGEILHKMLYLILEALKSLGAPVGTIEKPTAK